MNKVSKYLLGVGVAVAVAVMIPGVGLAATNSSSSVIDPTDPSDAPKISQEITNKSFDTATPTFSGYTIPNSLVTIYIYSKPIVGTTYADATGYWSWTPSEAIPAGDHTIQSTVTDSQGHVSLASAPVKFAVSSNIAGASKATTNWVIYAIWALVAIFILAGGYALTRKRSVED